MNRIPPIRGKFSEESSSTTANDVNNDEIVDLVMSMRECGLVKIVLRHDHRAQIWIYYGGPDFQLDSPSVIIYDTIENGGNPISSTMYIFAILMGMA